MINLQLSHPQKPNKGIVGFKWLIILAFLFLPLSLSVWAKSHFDTLAIDTQQDLKLLQHITTNPCLLNPNYLQHYLGPKAGGFTSPSLNSSVSKTFWLDRSENFPRYSFEQSTSNSNKSSAEFSILFTRLEDVRIKDLSKIFNQEPNITLDKNGQPAISYSLSSTLKILAYEDPHVVNLNRIALQYSGPILPPPTKADIDEAIEYRRNAALEHARLGNHNKATGLLRSHLRANPNDAEAHLKLAESYKALSYMNEAITEYRLALANCNGNKELYDRCIAGLHSLKVDLPNLSLQPANNSSSCPPHERININTMPDTVSQSDFNSPDKPKSSPKTKSLDIGF